MKLTSVGRINLTIVAMSIASIMLCNLLGLLPDERRTAVNTRIEISQTLASNVIFLVASHRYEEIEQQLALFAARNSALRTIGLRRADNAIISTYGDHLESWESAVRSRSDGCFIVPIQAGNGKWGNLELQYDPVFVGIGRYISPSVVGIIAFVVPLIGITAYFHLRKILKYLDPKRAVPPRVRQTLDSFAEGVVLLDKEYHIVLANDAFAELVEGDVDDLIGKSIKKLQFVDNESDGESRLPWQLTKITLEVVNARTVMLDCEDGRRRTFSVNSSPVLDEEGLFQGIMVALADVTPLEQKRAELAHTLDELNHSKDEITKQNEELRFLATRDSLTGCLNRRTFFELFDECFKRAREDSTPLCSMMVDIDFFKSINDNYGHGKGDEVLRETGRILNELARTDDIVCRYGGEEFSVLMPGLNLTESTAFAERIRLALAAVDFKEFKITASLGVSEFSLGAEDPQGLLDQADKCLYVAKRSGRNQVVRFDDVPEELEVDESKISRVKLEEESEASSVPFAAVNALLSALAYRDAQTAAHSTRVSSYAALLAQRFLSSKEVHLVEIAGLLHDIGKIGVPDAILLKPGRLTEEEWKLMEKHDRIGVEIVNRAFKNDILTDYIRHHHSRFDGGGADSIGGDDIPLGARILTIADSFDAMISDRPYRKGMPTEDALKELDRCAGTQFDPELVRVFAEIVRAGVVETKSYHGLPEEIILSIGEQIERITEAADSGDKDTFIALTDRLRNTAERSNLTEIAAVAEKALDAVSGDGQLEALVKESFELLSVCRSLATSVVNDAEESMNV
ncbi:MAG: diguanylate cyclase [Pirellulaceae bacterium]